MHEPDKINPHRLADYLEVITRAVFQAGMHWGVVDAKWAGFREVFAGFDPRKVAGLTDKDVDRICLDTRVIRNRPKIHATVANARTLLELADGPSAFRRWLGSHGDYEQTALAVRREFKYIGDSGAYYVLWVVGEPVPDFERWAKSRNFTPRPSTPARGKKPAPTRAKGPRG